MDAIAIVICLLTTCFAVFAPRHSSPARPQAHLAPESLSVRAPLSPSARPPSHGLPGRSSRTRAGALAAGADYATLVAQLFPLGVEQAKAVVADAASDQARERLLAAVEANLVPLQQAAGDLNAVTTYRQAVLATRLASYSADKPVAAGGVQQPADAAPAVAQVWVWTLLTVSHVPAKDLGSAASADNSSNATGAFGTVHLDLVWERGAWRIDDSTTLDGPTPLVGGTPSSGTELNADLRGFTDWRP